MDKNEHEVAHNKISIAREEHNGSMHLKYKEIFIRNGQEGVHGTIVLLPENMCIYQ